jgi:hypothetical protein
MSQSEKSEKRIVSKTEYAVLTSRKSVLMMFGFLLSIGAAMIGLLIGTVLLCALIYQWCSPSKGLPEAIQTEIVISLGRVIICVLLYRIGLKIYDKAHTLEKVVPFTQANTAHLAAEESLVRASTEPVAEQEKVLLRAAKLSQETPAEQLLRSCKPLFP